MLQDNIQKVRMGAGLHRKMILKRHGALCTGRRPANNRKRDDLAKSEPIQL